MRAFVYADNFLLAVEQVIDHNFLVLHRNDGTPYARLLSVQTADID